LRRRGGEGLAGGGGGGGRVPESSRQHGWRVLGQARTPNPKSPTTRQRCLLGRAAARTDTTLRRDGYPISFPFLSPARFSFPFLLFQKAVHFHTRDESSWVLILDKGFIFKKMLLFCPFHRRTKKMIKEVGWI
jgi:hypothetical protein